jgi:acetyl-CoA C-acetyltransferase
LLEEYAGAAKLETYTVFFDREGAPRFGVVIARTPQGARFLARVDGADGETIARLTDATIEPVGAEGMSTRHADGLNRWRFT